MRSDYEPGNQGHIRGHRRRTRPILLKSAEADTASIVASATIFHAAAHFAGTVRTRVFGLSKKLSALKKHVDALSYDILPTLFTNANVKTINLEGYGRFTVNVRWTATMIDKRKGMEWLRETGNEGLIIETVNAQTLAAFAKAEALSPASRCPTICSRSDPRSACR